MPHSPDTVWSVSSLNFEIRTLLEKGVGTIWIEGEISNFARPASGHWYFTLKDDRAQLRAAMFRNRNGRAGFTPQNGQQVLVRAQVTLYEARGDFQIIVEHLEEAGAGLLMRRYEELKKKLADEGLFDPAHKKPLPARAAHIGIITSASGAAIRDALSVIKRRSPITQVTVFPTQVQGEQAGAQIVKAIQSANRFGQCDVLLLVRGGGSLEDLWCFNDEAVACAIFASDTPIVSGIGHEIDFTIADFVADQRAPTPSVAAESVTMDQYELMSRLDLLSARLLRLQQQRLVVLKERCDRLGQQLLGHHPRRRMEVLRQRLHYTLSRLQMVQHNRLSTSANTLQRLAAGLDRRHPGQRIERLQQRVDDRLHQLLQALRHQLDNRHHQLRLQARSLDNLSPLKTLGRGYAAVSKEDRIISAAGQLQRDDVIDIRFSDGSKKASIL
jgi:exodeoxyribonuclease VII large subunit